MRTVTNLFLLNMAASDMFSTLFAVPSLLATEISPNRWPLGDFMCPATNVISTISVSVSIYSMVALALERFVHHFAVTFQHFLVWGPVTRQVPSTIKLGARGLTSKSSLISFASHFPITTGKIANSFEKGFLWFSFLHLSCLTSPFSPSPQLVYYLIMPLIHQVHFLDLKIVWKKGKIFQTPTLPRTLANW